MGNSHPRAILNSTNEQFIQSCLVHLTQTFLMPGEEFIRQGDIARSLYFAVSGSIEVRRGRDLVYIVRGKQRDLPLVVGELGFFLGMAQPYSGKVSAETYR